MNKKPIVYGAVLLGAAVTAVVIAENLIKHPPSSTINPNAPATTEQTMRIMASPQRVWQVMSQIDQWAGWQPGVSKATLKGPLRPGSSFNWTSNGMNIHSTLHTVVPGLTLGWYGKALGSFAVHNWHFTPLADGTTEVRVEESMEGWLVSLLGSSIQKALDKGTNQLLQALRKIAEADQA